MPVYFYIQREDGGFLNFNLWLKSILASLLIVLYFTYEGVIDLFFDGFFYKKYLAMLFIFLFVTYAVFHTVVFFVHRGLSINAIKSGSDTISEISQDRCPEYKVYAHQRSGPAYGSSSSLVSCPHCQSMRLADLYWYKTDRVAQGHTVAVSANNIQENMFFGCLKCGKMFEYVQLLTAKDRRTIIIMAFVFFVAVLLPFNWHLVSIFLSKIGMILPPKPIPAFIGMTLWFYFTLANPKKIRVEENLSLNWIER